MITNTLDNGTTVLKSATIKIDTKKMNFKLDSKHDEIVKLWNKKKKLWKTSIPIVILHDDYYATTYTCFCNNKIMCNQSVNHEMAFRLFLNEIWKPVPCLTPSKCPYLQNSGLRCNQTIKMYFQIPELLNNCNKDFFEINTSCGKSKQNIIQLKFENTKNEYPMFLNMNVVFEKKNYFNSPLISFEKREPTKLEKICYAVE
jgi:hypothetical protein